MSDENARYKDVSLTIKSKTLKNKIELSGELSHNQRGPMATEHGVEIDNYLLKGEVDYQLGNRRDDHYKFANVTMYAMPLDTLKFIKNTETAVIEYLEHDFWDGRVNFKFYELNCRVSE